MGKGAPAECGSTPPPRVKGRPPLSWGFGSGWDLQQGKKWGVRVRVMARFARVLSVLSESGDVIPKGVTITIPEGVTTPDGVTRVG